MTSKHTRNKKPLMIYFRSSNDCLPKVNLDVVAEYNKILPVDVVPCDGWREFSRLLLDDPDQISINSNVFTSNNVVTIEDTISMLQTNLKLAGLTIPIAVVVENNTPQHVVLEAERLGLQGLIPYDTNWDPADIMSGIEAMANGKVHWPQHIIDRLPNLKILPNIVYYNDDHSKSPVCTSELSRINGATWSLPSTWQELIREIENGESRIVFHIDMIAKSNERATDFINALNTVVKFIPGHTTLKILVLITPTTTQQQIKELKDAGILGIGYDVSYYSMAQAVDANRALLANEPYWPEHIINQLPCGQTKDKNYLTPRQGEIAELIKNRGISNKHIARQLGISESAVKLHVGAILKKHNLRNRTQLAVALSKGLSA